MDDEELLLRVAAGDRKAFRQLYHNTDRILYSFILSVLKNTQDTEEVMQETYMKVWTSASSYKAQGKPLAWMLTIARNLCYMRFRERNHMAGMGLEELGGEEPGGSCPELELLPDALALRAALEDLKEEERQAVLLHAAGLKHREIAEMLKLPLATVISRYNRSLKKLKHYLREE